MKKLKILFACDFCGWEESYSDLIHARTAGWEQFNMPYHREDSGEEIETHLCPTCFDQVRQAIIKRENMGKTNVTV